MRCVWLLLSMFMVVPLSARAQTTLTGAIQFSTNSTGAFYDGQIWNTLGGDHWWDLWLALNPDATSPVNGPSDAQSGISIPLEVGRTYKYYIFSEPNATFSFVGLNLFFDGSNSTPGISIFGAVNGSNFAPNASTSLTLQGDSVAGSGSASYNSSGIVVVLSGFDWNTAATPPGDVCPSYTFAPLSGGAADFSGSFTLQVWPAAA